MKTQKTLGIYYVKDGQTALARAAELKGQGIVTADSETIKSWLLEHPEMKDRAPVVFVDPTAKPRTSGLEGGFAQIPAHVIEPKVGLCLNGWIDVSTIAQTRKDGVLIALLGA